MKIDEAVALADRRAWEQTTALLGPIPSISEGTDVWQAKRAELANEIMAEFRAGGLVQEEDNLST